MIKVTHHFFVIPAKAGTQLPPFVQELGSRLRGNDEKRGRRAN